MDEHASVKIHEGPRCWYELVYFDERREWFIRGNDRNSQEQCYSSTGYDSKADAMRAFNSGPITYTVDVP